MANQSSSSASVILCVSFNQDNSCFAIGTRGGFKIFNCNTGKVSYERAIGAFSIVEMLYSSSLLAIVGAGEQASLSPRRLCLFNTVTGTALRELNFLTSIIAVRLNRKRLVVVLQEKTFIYDSNSIAILDTVDTVPNAKGLCAFSPSLDGCYLALPASTTKGSVLVYNVMELQLHCEIDAHRSPLVAIALSSNGMYIATASEQGTIIRVHLVSQATKSYSFRRGTYPSTIYSLSFGPSTELPDILTATSSSGSIHAFFLGFILDQRSKRSSSLLGSVIPNSINDAFEPGFHHVFRNANPAGVKSYATIRSIDKVASTSVSQIATSNYATIRSMDNVASTSMSQVATFKACISIISYNGYFQEYSLSFDHLHEPLWSLEREFNLLKAVPDNVNNS